MTEDNQDVRELLREIDDDGEQLTEWEIDFLDSAMKRANLGLEFTEAQLAVIRRIHEQRVHQ